MARAEGVLGGEEVDARGAGRAPVQPLEAAGVAVAYVGTSLSFKMNLCLLKFDLVQP